jgi:hypothetical protein
MNEFREILLQNFKADWLFLRFSWPKRAVAGHEKIIVAVPKTAHRRSADGVKISCFQSNRSEFT